MIYTKKQCFILLFTVSLVLSSCAATQNHLAKPISIPPNNVIEKTVDDIENQQNDVKKSMEDNNVVTPDESTDIDMTGDYIGNISCPEPPIESSYTVYNKNNPYECIVLYVENLDNANIKFHLTKAVQDSSTGKYSEDLIFKEHIAHYNGSSYEYIGINYHLYFQFSITEREQIVASDNKMSVYGLNNLFDQSSYGNNVEYNGINGIQFILNVPFAG